MRGNQLIEEHPYSWAGDLDLPQPNPHAFAADIAEVCTTRARYHDVRPRSGNCYTQWLQQQAIWIVRTPKHTETQDKLAGLPVVVHRFGPLGVFPV
jgi:hypothetical protein